MRVNYLAKVMVHDRDRHVRRPVTVHGRFAVEDTEWDDDSVDGTVDREEWEIDAWEDYLAHVGEGAILRPRWRARRRVRFR